MTAFPITESDRATVRLLLKAIRDPQIREDFLREFENDADLECTLALGTALLHDFACEAIHLSKHIVEDAEGNNEVNYKQLDDIQADINTASEIYNYVFKRMKSASAN